MSKSGYIQRYLFIIRFIRNHPYCTLNELSCEVKNQLEFHQLTDIGFSEKTLRRDIKDISNLFGLSIEYNAHQKGYYIPPEENQSSNIEQVLEAFDILTTIGGDTGNPDFIFSEKRHTLGTEHFMLLKKSIQECRLIQFEYHKFFPEESKIRCVEPHALMQSRNRWYLLGFDHECPEKPKAFGLDRIHNLSSLQRKFNKTQSIDWRKKYEYCFAMFSLDTPPEKVILSVDHRDGNYIETMPIHYSQSLSLKGDRIIVELYIQITLDFIMELMSRSWSLEVIEPLSLREKLHQIYTDAEKRNQF